MLGKGVKTVHHTKDQVIDEVASWIDTTVLAEMMVSHLEEEGEEPTVDRCKELWYAVLERLIFTPILVD
ncbi:MAG: hypothetical protein DDT30_01910 [Dehalococcoidia bacterium]|nr:hypothetical protein [Bacillota bacterium]